jgi:SAM-dependent methyltransferase
VEDNFFDAVISVNAIDHVDDIRQTASAIRRILKPDGLLCMHIHYHAPKLREPIAIDDDLFRDLFGWCGDLKKLMASRTSYSAQLPEDQSFVLWSNF